MEMGANKYSFFLFLKDKAQVSISLWREAALFSFAIGDEARLTHLKGHQSSYGYRVHSTNFTVCEVGFFMISYII